MKGRQVTKKKKVDLLQEGGRMQSRTVPWWPRGHGGPRWSVLGPGVPGKLHDGTTSSARPGEAVGSLMPPFTCGRCTER